MNPQDTYVDPLLTNISVAYKNDNYIADQFFPTVLVPKASGKYFVTDKENLRAPADAKRGLFGRANRVINGLTEASYVLEEKTLETPIAWSTLKMYSDPFDPKSNAVNLVSEKLLIDNELDLLATVNAAVTPTDLSAAWGTISTDIVGTVRTQKIAMQKATGKKPNKIIIGIDALGGILKNTAFLDSVKYAGIVNEKVLRDALAQWLDVEQVIIGEATYNTAKEGQTDSMSYIWGETVVLAYVAPAPAIETPSAGYRLTLEGGRYVDTWSEQAIKADFVRANDYYDNKVVDTGCLYVWTNAV